MCGRYRIRGELADGEPEDFFRHTRITPNFTTRYNVGPGQRSPILSLASGQPNVEEMLWRQPPLYLARAENIDRKPSFKPAFESRRCLIPMHGFYEWDERVMPKQPWHFHLRGDGLLMVAGLWTKYDGAPAFTLITTTPNAVVSQAHHRMPAIIPKDQWDRWLDPSTPAASLLDLLHPISPDGLEGWKISLRVNNWRNDDPGIIDRYEPPRPTQMELGL